MHLGDPAGDPSQLVLTVGRRRIDDVVLGRENAVEYYRASAVESLFSPMKLLPVTILIIVAAAGCDRQSEPSGSSASAANEIADTVTMDANDILFTTPTLNDSIPANLRGSSVGTDSIQTHEDNWRQFEFIDAALKREIDAELADIATIWDKNSVSLGDSGTAFREVHVRKRIPTPLQLSMPLADFEALVGQKTVPMTFFGYDEVLRDVHATQIDNLVVYAHIQDDRVIAIGFDALDQFALPTAFLDRLSGFVREHNVMLVHWRSRTLFETTEDIMKYFGARG